jgi:hypothetical protein
MAIKKVKQIKEPTTKAGKKQDANTKAMKVGKRISASGNVYTEKRSNRSDVETRAKKGKRL